ncbi:hypothetical protein [Pseudoalteromonas luteoviolacea]|uniref:Uncharacterized protein n=1 Tax=Pseudoalteromonas luteoviolacea S4054 TaxID=1129367 RepID=A0A0F6AFQ1_9GAMM|nr:hypothetical protein [Pseudoalteromonas luteoviolacea]AOT08273.1 hypothetical protein S4054249_10655 [Pseudoalteromonas luteoviolacea]AOT13189.1 hypothetical protein S40542_10630 [Pseudoalteromonas luteoviolacea]AOT18102.1 hypothetical protein S4054_10630 [Pseudoalteromonas luteoviolacea]KKE84209.1 hypothetical protein N479_09935 [Pseudoalteromonas luteoviolacea S4054]KZN76186.1 hypothetical protein N481_07480 [Pseudoalteromonas luteoviolacea S4047-1]
MQAFKKLQQLNKKRVLSTVWFVVALSWLAMFAVLFTTDGKSMHITAVTIAAIATELAVWCTAAVLGVAVVDGRKAIVSAIKNKLTGQRGLKD